VGPPTYAGNGR